jgi:hypothetical protein
MDPPIGIEPMTYALRDLSLTVVKPSGFATVQVRDSRWPSSPRAGRGRRSLPCARCAREVRQDGTDNLVEGAHAELVSRRQRAATSAPFGQATMVAHLPDPTQRARAELVLYGTTYETAATRRGSALCRVPSGALISPLGRAGGDTASWSRHFVGTSDRHQLRLHRARRVISHAVSRAAGRLPRRWLGPPRRGN